MASLRSLGSDRGRLPGTAILRAWRIRDSEERSVPQWNVDSVRTVDDFGTRIPPVFPAARGTARHRQRLRFQLGAGCQYLELGCVAWHRAGRCVDRRGSPCGETPAECELGYSVFLYRSPAGLKLDYPNRAADG